MKDYKAHWTIQGPPIRNKKLDMPTTKGFPVKLCEACGYAWEMHWKYTVTHSDFPTYGLKKKKCKLCIEKEKKVNV